MRGFGNSMQHQQHQQQQQHQRMQQGAWWMEQQRQRERSQAQMGQQVAETAIRPSKKERPFGVENLRGPSFRSQVGAGKLRPSGPSVAGQSFGDDVRRQGTKDGAHPRARMTLLKRGALAIAAVIVVMTFPPTLLLLGVVGIGSIFVKLIRRKTIVGEARQIQQMHHNDALGAVTVLRFRVDRFDGDGNRLPPVPVELTGKFIKGSLQEGDWVEVTGRRRREATFRPKRIRNLTTGERVGGKRRLGAAIGMAIWWTLFLAFICGIVALVIAASS